MADKVNNRVSQMEKAFQDNLKRWDEQRTELGMTKQDNGRWSGGGRTLDEMWRDEKRKRREALLTAAREEKNKVGQGKGDMSAGGDTGAGGRPSGWDGVRFTGTGGRPFSVNKDLIGRGGPVKVRDLANARLREASERAADRAMRHAAAEEKRKESIERGQYMFQNYYAIQLEQQKRREAEDINKAEYLARKQLADARKGIFHDKPKPTSGAGSTLEAWKAANVGKGVSRGDRRKAAGLKEDGSLDTEKLNDLAGTPGVTIGADKTSKYKDTGVTVVTGGSGDRRKSIEGIVTRQQQKNIDQGGANSGLAQREKYAKIQADIDKREQEKADRQARLNEALKSEDTAVRDRAQAFVDSKLSEDWVKNGSPNGVDPLEVPPAEEKKDEFWTGAIKNLFGLGGKSGMKAGRARARMRVLRGTGR